MTRLTLILKSRLLGSAICATPRSRQQTADRLFKRDRCCTYVYVVFIDFIVLHVQSENCKLQTRIGGCRGNLKYFVFLNMGSDERDPIEPQRISPTVSFYKTMKMKKNILIQFGTEE